MGVDAERKRLEMAGATGAIEEAYRQGLTAHATRLNKVSYGGSTKYLYDVHTHVYTRYLYFEVRY